MTLEARVDRLEQTQQADGEQVRAALAAQAYGLSLVHADTGALRADMTELRADVTELRADVTELRGDVTEIKATLAELVRRLPPAPRQAGD